MRSDHPAPLIPILPVAEKAARSSLYEKQVKIHPRAVQGWYARWRWIMVWVTQVVFFGLPWLSWNSRQAVLFDLEQRRFFVFGLVLHPQDFIYLAALLVIAAMALFFFTAIAGRLWCGYACPQTVYTEIFLWIERRIEGDRQARMRLDASGWSAGKAARKIAKQASWLAVGLLTGYTFVGYFTPIRTLLQEAASLSFSPWEWFWVLFYGLITYANAGYLREQVCKYMCPYARIQSALIDMDSLVIAYDTARGEARGSRPRKADSRALGLGDCIDCTLCVQVCPTGIDIRNGLQNECIACAACVDVCDDVMGKMGYAPGLIRYSSGHGIAQGWSTARMLRRIWRPRVLIYGALLLLASLAFIAGLSLRRDYAVDVIKDRGTLARLIERGQIENVYRLQITNSTETAQTYLVSVSGLPGLTLASAAQLHVEPTAIGTLPLRLVLPPDTAPAGPGAAHPIRFEVWPAAQDPSRAITVKSTFFVPH